MWETIAEMCHGSSKQIVGKYRALENHLELTFCDLGEYFVMNRASGNSLFIVTVAGSFAF